MTSHDAQPSTEESLDVVAYLDERVINTIEQFRYVVATTDGLTRKQKDYWRQHLAGVSGAIETIRMALK